MDETVIMQLISTLLYGIIGLVIFIFSLIVLEKITQFSINKKIVEEGNIALAIVVGSIIIAIGMISSSAIQ
jgi:uncharacterized membrane protein YjfL (UPF0719 family)